MEWMPLFGGRLFMSVFEAKASDEVFHVALKLWWTAWQQVPAASLPNDDALLCKFAGLNKDIKAWRKLREADALHGFVECSDGRLYHALLAEQAMAAWERRSRDRERKAVYRAKQANGSAPPGQGQNGPVPHEDSGDRTRMSHGTGRGRDADVPNRNDGDGRVLSALTGQDRKREERKSSEATPRPAAVAAGPPPAGQRAQLFSEGLAMLRVLTGKPDRAGRASIGMLLGKCGDDCAKVFNAIWDAGEVRPADPMAWLVAAVQPRKAGYNPFLDPAFEDEKPREISRLALDHVH
jgi:hypothetical protein